MAFEKKICKKKCIIFRYDLKSNKSKKRRKMRKSGIRKITSWKAMKYKKT